MPAADIHTIIEKPFGPYPQSQILSDSWAPNAKKIPILTDVFLYLDANERVIGLDDTEVLYAPPDGSDHPAKSVIQWFGVMTIENLSWLSAQGQKWLQADLRERDDTLHISTKKSTLTLVDLYGRKKDEGLNIRVYLQGEKHASITYLVDNAHPTRMVLTSTIYRPESKLAAKDIQRRYIVESLDVDIVSSSRNFLARYQLLAGMEDIVSTDPSKTPRARRDINYWIDGYLRRRSAIEGNHRYIFNPEDSDLIDMDHGNTITPRHLRRLHRSTVAGIYASQAEWILAQQLGPQPDKRVVDLRVWYRFCLEVRQARSTPSSGEWGRPHGYQSVDNNLSLEQFIRRKFFVPDSRLNRLEKALKPNRLATPPSPAESEHGDAGPSPMSIQHQYDSDFTDDQPSSSEAEDPEAEKAIPMEMLSAIPSFCWVRPRLLDGTFVWECPGEGCQFKLDLLNPEASAPSIDPRHIAWLKHPRNWRNTAEHALRDRFDAIVGAHYQWHIKQVDLDFDITFEPERTTISKKRIDNHQHTPPQPPRKKIKVEETTHYPRLSLPRSRQSSHHPTPNKTRRIFIG